MQISPIRDSGPPKDRHAQIADAARQFEQVFSQMLVKSMRESARIGGESDGMFGGGAGADTYSQWFDSSMSEHLSQGHGLGIASLLRKEWDRPGLVAPKPEVTHVA